MFCPFCGYVLPDDSQFCPNCGKPISAGEPSQTAVPEPPAPVPSAVQPQRAVQAPVVVPPAAVSPAGAPAPRKKKVPVALIVIPVILILLAAAAGVGAYLVKSEYPDASFKTLLDELSVKSKEFSLEPGDSTNDDETGPVHLTFESCKAKWGKKGIETELEVEIRNLRSDVWSCNSRDFVFYADGKEIDPQDRPGKDTLERGERTTVKLAYEVPFDTEELRLEYRDEGFRGAEWLVKMSASMKDVLSFKVPSVSREVGATEFMGEFECISDSKELLTIEWYDFMLTFDCVGKSKTYFEGVTVYPYTDDMGLEDGNVVRLSTEGSNMYAADGFSYNIAFTYVPAEDSPYEKDTIYMESGDFKNAIYTRTDDSFYFEEYPTDGSWGDYYDTDWYYYNSDNYITDGNFTYYTEVGAEWPFGVWMDTYGYGAILSYSGGVDGFLYLSFYDPEGTYLFGGVCYDWYSGQTVFSVMDYDGAYVDFYVDGCMLYIDSISDSAFGVSTGMFAGEYYCVEPY